jgi:phosphoglycolate phosphatase
LEVFPLKFEAVIFDLDGTLLNTLEDLLAAVNHGLANQGFAPHGPAEFKYFVGDGREVMAERSLPESRRDPASVTRMCADIDAYYGQHGTDHTLPYSGIPELLDALTARGVRMAILSNKPHEFTTTNVSQLLTRWKFEPVMGAKPSVPRKPNGTAALKIAGQLKIDPANCIFLGDSDIDMQTAVNAGMYPVGAAWGFRTEEELVRAGAKKLIRKPAELLEIITGNSG